MENIDNSMASQDSLVFGSKKGAGRIGRVVRLHSQLRHAQKPPVGDSFLIPANTPGIGLSIRSALSMLAYRAMIAMRALSPYLFAAIFVVLSQGARAASPAEVFVQQNIEKSYAILNDSSLSAQQRGDQFRALLTGIMDVKRVALFTLGQYGRTARPGEVDPFADAFSDFTAAIIQHDLAGNPGETLTVTGSVVHAPDDVIVVAKLTGSSRGNGAPINMGFRIRKNASGEDTLVDIQIEGVSMEIAQRSDFSSWLQQHHGDVSALSQELQSRAKIFRERDIAAAQKSRTTPAG